MVYAQPNAHKLLWDFDKQKDDQKKRTCKIVEFAVPADHRVKVKRRINTSTLLGN